MIRSIAAMLCLSLLALAGCGGGGGGGDAAPPDEPDLGFRVLEIDPFDGELYVRVDKTLVAKFSDPLIPGTIDEGNFLLYERASGKVVTGTVTMGGDRLSASFKPDRALLLNTGYRIRILPEVTSIAGHTLPEEFRTVFTTAITSDEPPPDDDPPPKGSLRTIDSLRRGRSSHTATLLDGGKVLITAGFTTGSSVTATAEIFDPKTETFRFTSTSLATARGFHAATKMADGRVMISGGLVAGSFAETPSMEIFTPSSDEFSISSVFLLNARAYHTATLLDDDRILFAGGTVPTANGSFSSKSAELWDPNPGGSPASRPLGDMNVYRAGHTATKLADGRVLLIGGNSTDKRVEIFDPVTGIFNLAAGQLKVARRGHSATLLPDGNVLVMGGGERSAEIYVTDKDYFIWAPGYPLEERKDHTATLTDEGIVLFTGGSKGILGDTQNPLFFLRSTELYDPRSGAFIGSAPQLTYPTTRHRATRLLSGAILITGGSNVDGTQPELDRVQIYESD